MKLGRIASVTLFSLLLIGSVAYAQESVDDMMQQAKNQYRHRRYQAALDQLMRVTEEAPDRADAFYLIGYCHLMLRQYPESVKAFARAFELDPDFDPRTIFQAPPKSAPKDVSLLDLPWTGTSSSVTEAGS